MIAPERSYQKGDDVTHEEKFPRRCSSYIIGSCVFTASLLTYVVVDLSTSRLVVHEPCRSTLVSPADAIDCGASGPAVPASCACSVLRGASEPIDNFVCQLLKLLARQVSPRVHNAGQAATAALFRRQVLIRRLLGFEQPSPRRGNDHRCRQFGPRLHDHDRSVPVCSVRLAGQLELELQTQANSSSTE